MFRKMIVFLSLNLLFITGAYSFVFASGNIVDRTNSLNEAQIDELLEKCSEIREQWFIDPVIVITDSLDGKKIRDFADDFYDYGGYGEDFADYSGLILVLDTKGREMWISETGKCIDIFTYEKRENIFDNLVPYASNSDYYGLCGKFLSEVSNTFLSQSYLYRLRLVLVSPIPYIASLAISLLSVFCLSLSRKSKSTVGNSSYEEKGSFMLTTSTDNFINEIVTSTAIPKHTGGSGGGGSTHTGSSGRRHSGGGRRF